MIYSAVGGGGIALGLWRGLGGAARMAGLAATAAVAVCLLAWAAGRYRKHRPALEAEPNSPEKQRRERWFHIINGGQWLVILVFGNVLVNVGLSDWVVPAAMFIVGLHFLPLGRILDNSQQYGIGAAFLLVSVVYPFAASPLSGAGPVAAGLVLWASAAWGVMGVSGGH